jgi:hypothetical protein
MGWDGAHPVDGGLEAGLRLVRNHERERERVCVYTRNDKNKKGQQNILGYIFLPKETSIVIHLVRVFQTPLLHRRLATSTKKKSNSIEQ